MNLSVRVVAVEKTDSVAPLEAILEQDSSPFLLGWWGGQAWETLEITDVSGLVDPDSEFRRCEMNLPTDWQKGYLVAEQGEVKFLYGEPTNRPD